MAPLGTINFAMLNLRDPPMEIWETNTYNCRIGGFH